MIPDGCATDEGVKAVWTSSNGGSDEAARPEIPLNLDNWTCPNGSHDIGNSIVVLGTASDEPCVMVLQRLSIGDTDDKIKAPESQSLGNGVYSAVRPVSVFRVCILVVATVIMGVL